MPLTPFPDDHAQQNPSKPSLGCLPKLLIVCLLVLFSTPFIIKGILFHTTVPLRLAAGALEFAFQQSQLRVSGISGNLHSGFGFDSAHWSGGEIAGFSIRYGRPSKTDGEAFQIHEIRFAKFHAQIPALSGSTTFHASNSGSSTSLSSPQSAPLNIPDWFLEKLDLNDIHLTNPSTGFNLQIHSIAGRGFHAGSSGFGLREIHVESDCIHLETHAAEPSVPGTPPEYLQLDLVLLPKLHPAIQNPLPLTIAAQIGREPAPPPGKPASQFVSLTYHPDAPSILRTHGLDLRPFLRMPVPGNLTCSLPLSDSPYIQPQGSFDLGSQHFTLENPDDKSDTLLSARSSMGGTTLCYQLAFPQNQFQQSLRSIPPSRPEDLLALLFYSKPARSLSQSEKTELTRLKTFFKFPDQP